MQFMDTQHAIHVILVKCAILNNSFNSVWINTYAKQYKRTFDYMGKLDT